MFDSTSWRQLRERYLHGLDDEEEQSDDDDAARAAPPSQPKA